MAPTTIRRLPQVLQQTGLSRSARRVHCWISVGLTEAKSGLLIGGFHGMIQYCY